MYTFKKQQQDYWFYQLMPNFHYTGVKDII